MNHIRESAPIDRLTHRYFSGVGANSRRQVADMARKNQDRRESLTAAP